MLVQSSLPKSTLSKRQKRQDLSVHFTVDLWNPRTGRLAGMCWIRSQMGQFLTGLYDSWPQEPKNIPSPFWANFSLPEHGANNIDRSTFWAGFEGALWTEKHFSNLGAFWRRHFQKRAVITGVLRQILFSHDRLLMCFLDMMKPSESHLSRPSPRTSLAVQWLRLHFLV